MATSVAVAWPSRLTAWLRAPQDGAGLAVVRIAFGSVMAVAMGRVLAKGWVARFYHDPADHFSYRGFGWLAPLPPGWMEALVVATGLASVCLAVGCWTRRAALAFTLGFTWIELCDIATYLNHYYLVSLVGGLLVLLPAGACWSVDALRRTRRGNPALAVHGVDYAALRAQIAVVYVMAAVAKMQGDWLLEGLPLRLWLARHADAPLVGPLLAAPVTAIAASWVGMLYDLTIPAWLLWRRTRAAALVAVVGFHLATWLLFPIGMFPWIMIALASVFVTPGAWRRRRVADHRPAGGMPRRLLSAVPAVLAVHLVAQVLLPLRCHLHPGDVHWHEQGFRFAWRVMVMEKTGDLRYRVVDRAKGGIRMVDPACALAPHQHKQLVTQPDLILAHAHRIAQRGRAAGRHVAVYAESWVSLNGRAPARLIDPTVDLTRVRDGWDRSGWVLPSPRSRLAVGDRDAGDHGEHAGEQPVVLGLEPAAEQP